MTQPDDIRANIRGKLRDYRRLYAFLAQLITFTDTDLEKLYPFSRLLLRKIQTEDVTDLLPLEVQQNIDIDSFRIRQTYTGSIDLERGPGDLKPKNSVGQYHPKTEEKDTLSAIIDELNERFGADFGEHVQETIIHLKDCMVNDEAVRTSLQLNTPENARLTFDQKMDECLYTIVSENFDFYQRVKEDQDYGTYLKSRMFDLIRRELTA
jgi:type I restriction enzyme R subunit